jgi:hypothetical protein
MSSSGRRRGASSMSSICPNRRSRAGSSSTGPPSRAPWAARWRRSARGQSAARWSFRTSRPCTALKEVVRELRPRSVEASLRRETEPGQEAQVDCGSSDRLPPDRRTSIPAARRYALAVSRRTPVSISIRRSDQPSRPSATIGCLFSSPKTLAIQNGSGRAPHPKAQLWTACR